jgi:hypothetical protein
LFAPIAVFIFLKAMGWMMPERPIAARRTIVPRIK